MSFEAINSITRAESQARADIAAAQQRAAQMTAEAEREGRLSVERMKAKAETALKELSCQIDKKAETHAEKINEETENSRALLRARAEKRSEKVASMILERITGECCDKAQHNK